MTDDLVSDDLVKWLRSGNVAGMNEAADRIDKLEHLFDLRWAADMRAIRLWQSAHPDQPRTWPDHADLGTWCLSRIEKLEAALQKIDRSECLHPHDIVEIARKVLVEGKNGQ